MKNERQKTRSKERGMMGVAVTLMCTLVGIASTKASAQSVAITGGTVYVVAPDGTILSVPDTGGALTPFAQVPVGCIWDGGATMSPDAVYFACSVDEQRESDVWVVENFDPLRSSRD